jgi:hypothetical protein
MLSKLATGNGFDGKEQRWDTDSLKIRIYEEEKKKKKSQE